MPIALGKLWSTLGYIKKTSRDIEKMSKDNKAPKKSLKTCWLVLKKQLDNKTPNNMGQHHEDVRNDIKWKSKPKINKMVKV